MHPQNAALIEEFYAAFSQLDWKKMQACYHAEATFSDPVFPHLNAREVGQMWQMLCSRAQDFSLEYSQVEATAASGSCRWAARYLFTKTGRMVENRIEARFTFRDGKIFRHQDSFDFWRWSRQALGLPGLLLGWTPFLQQKVRQNAAYQLQRFASDL